MSPLVLKILSSIIIFMGVLGLVTGKVVAGSRGLESNYYTRKDDPVLYYCFVFIYLILGIFLFSK